MSEPTGEDVLDIKRELILFDPSDGPSVILAHRREDLRPRECQSELSLLLDGPLVALRPCIRFSPGAFIESFMYAASALIDWDRMDVPRPTVSSALALSLKEFDYGLHRRPSQQVDVKKKDQEGADALITLPSTALRHVQREGLFQLFMDRALAAATIVPDCKVKCLKCDRELRPGSQLGSNPSKVRYLEHSRRNGWINVLCFDCRLSVHFHDEDFADWIQASCESHRPGSVVPGVKWVYAFE